MILGEDGLIWVKFFYPWKKFQQEVQMTSEEVKSKLKEFFMSDLGVDGSVLQYDTPLFGEEIGLDSVDSLEIISFVDTNFGVSMTGAGKEPFQSIDTIADFIEKHKV